MRTRQAGESALLLLDAIDLLQQSGIAYAVVGAMAAAVHGVVRASMDADAVVLLPVQRVAELERQYRASGFATVMRRGDAEDPIGAVLALHDAFGNRVDLLFGLKGLGADAFGRTITVPFQDRDLLVIGREDFVAMKVFAGGPLDLLDAERALAAAGGDLDPELLRRVAAGYGPGVLSQLEALIGPRR
ncbi:MAG: hypothetical protein MUC71_08135 [Steroidobacteraceae bacterium]|jgi:hypothetical protein|nr:hypothetical protein [Steroidobacteraceae bacterium]